MNKVDYIIVGGGYAGLFFALRLLENGKSFKLFSDGKLGASRVSAGMVNPVVLKKFTTFWQAQNQINFLHLSLESFKRFSGVSVFVHEPVHRIFHNEEEKVLWSKKRLNEDLLPFLDEAFYKVEGVINDFETGRVLQSGRINVPLFFEAFYKLLEEKGCLVREAFKYDLLKENTYNNLAFSRIVFCEGISVKENPYFSSIEINPNKGHQIYVKLNKELNVDVTLKKKHFLFRYNDDLHFYGGTYDREHLNEGIDSSAVEQLQNGLNEFYKDGYDIREVHYGFRPTVRDRRPIIGQHKEHKNYYVFNGLGARGVLNGCFFSQSLYDFIEKDIPLPEEVDLRRFDD